MFIYLHCLSVSVHVLSVPVLTGYETVKVSVEAVIENVPVNGTMMVGIVQA